MFHSAFFANLQAKVSKRAVCRLARMTTTYTIRSALFVSKNNSFRWLEIFNFSLY